MVTMDQKAKDKTSNLSKNAVYLNMRGQDLHFALSEQVWTESVLKCIPFLEKSDHFHYPNSLQIVILAAGIITADLCCHLFSCLEDS